jgi:DNA-binding protein
MYEKDFYKRLYKLRRQRGVSARDMSLSLGQNAGYINNIENGNNLPSMKMFFYICEYFNITPRDFFDISAEKPEKITNILFNLRKLNSEQIDNIDFLINELTKR